VSGLPVLVVAAVRQEIGRPLKSADGRIEMLLTGMGRRNADAKVRRYLAGKKIGLLVSAGFAGGTLPGYKVGDLLIASEVHDMASGKSFKPFWCPTRLDGRVRTGRFLTADSVMPDPAAKEEAGRKFGAVGVDMETAAVAEAAVEHGVPWVGLRAVLDPMEVRLAVGSAAQALQLLLTPSGRRELSGFFGSVRTASRSLTEGVKDLVARVG
jgi:nucleoside phosphorylase